MLPPTQDILALELMTHNAKILFPEGLYFKDGENYYWVTLRKNGSSFSVRIVEDNRTEKFAPNVNHSLEAIEQLARFIVENKIQGIIGNIVVLKHPSAYGSESISNKCQNACLHRP